MTGSFTRDDSAVRKYNITSLTSTSWSKLYESGETVMGLEKQTI
jgi:hypothetical protein